MLYAKSKTHQQSESKMLSENKILEEEALKQQLQSLTEIGALIKVQQQVIIDALQTFETKRKLQRKEEAQRAATIEKQKHLAHFKQQLKEELIQLIRTTEEYIRFRGTGWDANFKTSLKDFLMDDMVDDEVSCVAINGFGALILYDDGEFAHYEIPVELYNKLTGRQKSLPKPEYAALGPNDTYYIRFADGSSQWNGIGDDFSSYVKENEVDKVAFCADGGWFVSTEEGGFQLKGAFGDLVTKLKWPSNRKRSIENVSLGSCGAYFVSFTDGHWIYGGPSNDQYSYNLNNLVGKMNKIGKLRHVYFGASADDWLIRYQE
jgi:hypothetical protein